MEARPNNSKSIYTYFKSVTKLTFSRWFWRLIKNEKSDSAVVSNAFLALSRFKMKYHTKTNVPADIQSSVPNPVIYNETTEMDMINQSMFVATIGSKGAANFLRSVISSEIEVLPRNTTHNAMKRHRKIRLDVETKNRIQKITVWAQ